MHVLLAMLVTAVFMAIFVISAIVHENAYSLLAVVVLSTLVVIRVVYYAVSPAYPSIPTFHSHCTLPSISCAGSRPSLTAQPVQITSRDHHDLGMAVAAIVLLVASSVLALVTHHQFGWRQRSKVPQDRRVKNIDERRKAQVQVKRFLTVIKLDYQVRDSFA